MRETNMALKRINVNNHRCLVNVILPLKHLSLLPGGNGSGKSTVFEVAKKIQIFIRGDGKIPALFPRTTPTPLAGPPNTRF